MVFARKAEFHFFSSFLGGPRKNLWCNMSPVFSGNFLIASFFQEKTPYLIKKLRCTSVSRSKNGLHHNPYRCMTGSILEEVRWCRIDQMAYQVMCSDCQICSLSWVGSSFLWFVRVPSNRQQFPFKVVFLKQELRIGRIPANQWSAWAYDIQS